MTNIISTCLVIIIFLCCGYYWVIALAGVKKTSTILTIPPSFRFAITIPAHDEEKVIGQTINRLKHQNYPHELFDVFVVADFCSDKTAQIARDEGAICFERNSGERGQKGIALQWLFGQLNKIDRQYDAIVVFDADTSVDENFLGYMNSRISEGDKVIQGKHIISNPEDGRMQAFSWAMMTIDNRFSNQGRANLHLSAKNMGDSICYKTDVIRCLGFGKGLTEDYQFRYRLLLNNIRIKYEPSAIGYGQASMSIKSAQQQHSRWRKGTMEASAHFRKQALIEGIIRKNPALLDAAVASSIPAYSTLTLVTILVLLIHICLARFFSPILTYLWGGITFLWFLYPLFGLFLENSPTWAYSAILSGPIFILWRSWLVIKLRLSPHTVTWIRTPHK